MYIYGEASKALRAALGWSRLELAEKSGLGERTIIDFERGARVPHENNLKAIEAAFESEGVKFDHPGFICFPIDSSKQL
jgi:transcriptional regulator with XRE-family HTH domain